MNKYQNFDGIGNIKIIKRKARLGAAFVDSLVRIKRLPTSVSVNSSSSSLRAERSNLYPRRLWTRQRFFLPILVSVVLLGASFIAGSWLTLRTDKTFAEDQSESPMIDSSNQGAAISVVAPVAVPMNRDAAGQAGTAALGPVNQIPNEILFNLTLEQLEVYLQEALKTPEMKEAEKLADRKFKLKIYLDEKKSPLLGIADSLSELKHWKMVLAISNSESTLGKRCYTNNCSGIGVEPGHPYWRKYASKADWAKDMDKLIEKRYKNWTLEEMNGVYNRPGSENWILASKQILEELQERNIE